VSGLYAAMLRLDGQPCVVVGGGVVATRKLSRLLEAGALVTMVAPSLTEEAQRQVSSARVAWQRRPFQRGDLTGASLAFAATGSRQVNAEVAAEARRLGIPVNVADDPLGSSLQVPATLERAGVQVAISTGGRSPAFARRLREELEQWLSPARLELCELYAELRASLTPLDARPDGAAWASADSQALDLLRDGRREEARQLLRQQVLGAACGEL
jgi:precorrin-2 dehydrogenase / sirohydrochlorin ferrochelatase